MAEKEVQLPSVSVLEKNWLKRGLEVLRATLVRSKAKEVPGSEVEAFRQREIAQLDALLNKLS